MKFLQATKTETETLSEVDLDHKGFQSNDLPKDLPYVFDLALPGQRFHKGVR